MSTGSANRAKILLRAFVTPENEVIVQVIDNGTGLVQANFKETQLTNMRVGDTADIRIDTFPNRVFRGKVEQLSPTSGSQFALLPPDNATGNFTKVVQRVPVKIVFFPGQPYLDRLRPGFSAVVTVHTGKAEGRSDGDQ